MTSFLSNIKNKFKLISIVLLVLLTFKTCESCRRGSTIQWERHNNKVLVDSLHGVINVLENDILVLGDSIRKLNYQISNLDTEKQILYETNKSQLSTNRELIKTLNKNIYIDKK